MLETKRAFSGFAVKDIDAARAFYARTLGVDVDTENGNLALHLGPDHVVFAYPKPDHKPANYTILNFPVDDIDRTVDELTKAGVKLERYEGFEQDERGVHRGEGGPPIAWFTDPSGNILSVLEEHVR
jgi:catechol 2,3-dioxygenase-like lactoylglutathione lyase family enzyme